MIRSPYGPHCTNLQFATSTSSYAGDGRFVGQSLNIGNSSIGKGPEAVPVSPKPYHQILGVAESRPNLSLPLNHRLLEKNCCYYAGYLPVKNNITFAHSRVCLADFLFIANLHNHIERQGIEFLQFSFRWMNNLLMRELPLRCTIRLWDTYLVMFLSLNFLHNST